MDKLLRFWTLAVCLGFTAPAFAQTYYDSPVAADSSNCRAVAGQAEIDGTMQQIVGRAYLRFARSSMFRHFAIKRIFKAT